VLCQPWGVPSVLVERWVRRGGVLVMRRSWVRFPQAAPAFPHVSADFLGDSEVFPDKLWHEFVMPETACRGDTPDSLGVQAVAASRFEVGPPAPAMTLQQFALVVDSMDRRP
jgi:hypothetical protein